MTFDDTYRVGRCNSCYGKPAFAWKANTGLRLDDGMRCPKCHNLLDRTSREARYMRQFTEDELLWVFERTRQALRERIDRSEERKLAWQVEPETNEARKWALAMEEETLERLWKDHTRVDDGFRRWISSGTDEHDAAVKSM